MMRTITLLFSLLLILAGCQAKTPAAETAPEGSEAEVAVAEILHEEILPAEGTSPAPNEKPEGSQNEPLFDDSFILEEVDEFYKTHNPLTNVSLPIEIVDSVCRIAMEYYDRYGKMPSTLNDLYGEELRESKWDLKYVTGLTKEADKKSTITIEYNWDGRFKGNIYTVIYERKDEHVFTVYRDGELYATIYREGLSVRSEFHGTAKPMEYDHQSSVLQI